MTIIITPIINIRENLNIVKAKFIELNYNLIKILLSCLLMGTLFLVPQAAGQELKLDSDLMLNSEYEKITEERVNNISLSKEIILVNKNHGLPKYYMPSNLVIPDVPFPFSEFHEKKLMSEKAAEPLEKLFTQAEEDEINLYAVSGYRSYERQKEIFEAKVEEYGWVIANQVSAPPGKSEHQTGLAMDVTSPQVDFKLVQYFGVTREGQWLQEHAPQFGFIIRYPAGEKAITGYQYEPWHIRYVGKDVAQEIVNRGLTLEEYLTKKF